MRKVLLTLVVIGLGSSGVHAEEAPAVPRKVPFELTPSRHMIVSVKINGQGPFRLVFDTGAPIMLVNNKLAKQAGIVTKDTKKPPIALFGTMGHFPIDRLEMGQLQVNGVKTVVMDHPTVEVLSKAFGGIDGIVGFPMFARFKTTVDYQAKELTFAPSQYEPDDLIETLTKRIMSRPPAVARVVAPAAHWGLVVEKPVGDATSGIIIKTVRPDGAAAEAGLKAGDRLLTIDGRWTDSMMDCHEATSRIAPGTSVTVTINREGKDQKLTIKPRLGL